MCSHPLTLTKRNTLLKISITHTQKTKQKSGMLFSTVHTLKHTLTEIIPDQKVSRAETVRNYSEATPPLRQNITISQKQVQKWLQKHPPRTLRGRVF